MMRSIAILAIALLAAAFAVPVGSASVPNPDFVHVDFVQCVRFPCPPIVWCDPADTYNGAVHYERFHDCNEQVSVDDIDCIFGEHWESHTAGPLTVRYSMCNTP